MARQNVASLVKNDPAEDPIEIRSARLPKEMPPAEGETATVPAPPELGTVALSIDPDALRRMVHAEEERREIIREYIVHNLKAGTDFGTISTGRRESKPSLFKPGAEKICLLLQLRPRFLPDAASLAMAGNRDGLFIYICRLIDRQGRVVGEGRGAAELSERSGWTVNNAIKICEKRAQVDAVLRVAGLSEVFTQDLEDVDQRQAFEHENGPAQAPATNGTHDAVAEAPARYAAPAAESDDAHATEQQERTIRGLLPRAGIAEEELLASLRIEAIADLSRAKAARVIDRLTAKAREASQPPF